MELAVQAGAGFPVMKEEAVNKVGRTGGGQKHRENVLNQSKNAQYFLKGTFPLISKPLFCPISFCLLLCLKFQLKQPSLFAFAFVCCKCRAPFLLCFLFPLRQLLESEKALHGSDLRSPCLGSVTIVSVLKGPFFVSDYFCHRKQR